MQKLVRDKYEISAIFVRDKCVTFGIASICHRRSYGKNPLPK